MAKQPRFEPRIERRGRAPVEWSTALRLATERRTSAGDLDLLGALVDALFGDDRIGALLRTRAEGLFGVVPTFEASGDGRRKGRAVRALEGEEDWWSIAPEPESAVVLKYGLLAGACPAQLVWFEDGRARLRSGRNVPEIQPWGVRALRWDFDDNGWQIDIGRSGPEFVPFTPGNGQDLLFLPFGKRQPWQYGLWRGLAPWWVLKQLARDDWARAGATAASTSVESDKDAESSLDLRKQIAEAVAQLDRDGVCVLPPGHSIKLIELSATTSEIYTQQIAAANEAFAIAILGHNLTSKVDGGSHAAAQVGNDILLDLRRFDAEAWSTFCHDQVLVPWAKHNFGSAELAPWPLYKTAPPEDKAAMAAMLSVFFDAMNKAPDEIDRRALFERFEIETLSNAEVQRQRDEAAARQPIAPPGPPPPTSADTPSDAAATDAPAAEQAPPTTKAHVLRWLAGAARDPAAATLRASEWVKRLADAACASAPSTMRDSLDAALRAVELADSPAALRSALAELADEAPDPELEEVVERLMIIASSVGADAVLRDLDAGAEA